LPLFTSKKEIIYTLFLVAILFVISLFYEFYKYKKITTYSLHVTHSKVINSYEKTSVKGKKYTVLKLKNSDFTFNTISWKALHVNKGDRVKVAFYTKGIDFYSYLKGFYASLKFLHVNADAVQNPFYEYVQKQHKDSFTKELYKALFFASPISKELREDIAKWGISHLVAISGFHLGILSGILFFLLKPLYTFFQDKFFPYRNAYADLAGIVFLILGLYIYLIDFTPSVLRAFVMSIIGFLFFARNIKIISFSTLFFTISVVLILFPKLIFSIAFWLSVSGVFYIFLFLYHFANINKVSIFILINFWVYVLMLPIVHYIFDVFSFYQIFSPLLSMAFVVFYPLSLALHVSSFGGILDEFVLAFLSLHVEVSVLSTPLWFLLCFIGLSLLAIRFRLLAFFLPFISLSLFFI
jgi:competence protein ComEC